jgi:hypothetical protein
MTAQQWTNKMIQKDPAAYRRWQEEQRDKSEREAKERREEADFQSFKKMFVERGGVPGEAKTMYAKYKNDMALEAAKAHDQETSNRMRSSRARAV